MDFYHQVAKKKYPEQVYELFTGLILRGAFHSNKRFDYQTICSYLRVLVKIGGNSIAIQLIKQLMTEYMRRLAFREELQKINVK